MTLSTTQYTVVALVATVAIITIVRFELLCLKDLAQRSDAELSYLSRTGWTVVIAIVIPVGGVLYLVYGRSR